MSWTDIPDSSLQIAHAIMETVRLRDPETYSHCVRVSRGSRLLARAAGLDEVEQKVAEFAGLFHDIGKIGIADSILFKPGRLTDEEMNVVKAHPEMSIQIIKPLIDLEFFARLVPGVLYHHEWFNGQGYPHGVVGESIPLPARIVLIADTYDAITADRVYRKGRPAEYAYRELKDYSGRQFDPSLVKIYLQAHPGWGGSDQGLFGEMNAKVLHIKTAA
jgi:putative nucleotidyltransferase with HDIG domain